MSAYFGSAGERGKSNPVRRLFVLSSFQARERVRFVRSGEAIVFTGIVEEVGTIQELRFISQGALVTIAAPSITDGVKIGDSISVNGVCLTATRWAPVSSSATFRPRRSGSAISNRPGRGEVNLERSLMIGDRLGGHFVLGHVDGVGKLLSRAASGEGFEMSFEFPGELERYLVYKGSIAVNGISLTIASLKNRVFSVAVIPHTFESTNLKRLATGDLVNLEVDILGKYFERFFQLGQKQNDAGGSKLTAEYLKSQGF